MVEGARNVGEIAKDIRVVEFQVIENEDAGAIVNEFAAFVEKGGVVFVALDDEGGIEVSQLVTGREVERDTTDKVSGVHASLGQGKRSERRGGGFAVCSGYDDCGSRADEFFANELREANERSKALTQEPFDLRITSGYRIAHDDTVGRPLSEHLFVEALEKFDPGLEQDIRHGWVYTSIGTGHLDPLLLEQDRRVPHSRSTNPNEKNPHAVNAGKSRRERKLEIKKCRKNVFSLDSFRFFRKSRLLCRTNN